MTTQPSIYEQRERICNIIDRSEWKNSWHLPKNHGGDIDWFAAKTERQCRTLVEEARDGAITLLIAAETLLRQTDWERAKRKEEQDGLDELVDSIQQAAAAKATP